MPVTLTNIAFQALSLGVLAAYCWMIYAFRSQTVECLTHTLTFPSGDGGEKIGKGDKQLYDSFIAVSMTLGAISLGLVAVKLTAAALTTGTGTPGTLQWRLAGLAGTAGIEGLPSWVAVAAVGAVAAVVVTVVMAQMGLLKAAGGITLSQKFTDAIVLMKKNWLATTSLFTVPLATVWTGMNPVRDRVAAYVFVGVIVTLAALFIAHTLSGFLKQKVSLLVWFLYLCTVEIFPVCALVLTAIKSI